MEIILVILFILILLVALYFIDAQKNYEDFPYFVYPDEMIRFFLYLNITYGN